MSSLSRLARGTNSRFALIAPLRHDPEKRIK
jgi:hypothetical protein